MMGGFFLPMLRTCLIGMCLLLLNLNILARLSVTEAIIMDKL